MVMEAVPGVPLNDVWSRMTSLQHIECIESIGKISKELCSLEFANFGSLYFETPDRPAGAVSLDVNYCIGPNCARQHWGYGQEKGARSTMLEGHQGPCESSPVIAVLHPHAESPKGMTWQHTLQTLANSQSQVSKEKVQKNLLMVPCASWT
jgi:hypothetical protein